MILTQEVAILKSQEQFDEMLDFVRHAAREGTAIDQVERGLWSRLLSLGHAMLESFVQAHLLQLLRPERPWRPQERGFSMI